MASLSSWVIASQRKHLKTHNILWMLKEFFEKDIRKLEQERNFKDKYYEEDATEVLMSQ